MFSRVSNKGKCLSGVRSTWNSARQAALVSCERLFFQFKVSGPPWHLLPSSEKEYSLRCLILNETSDFLTNSSNLNGFRCFELGLQLISIPPFPMCHVTLLLNHLTRLIGLIATKKVNWIYKQPNRTIQDQLLIGCEYELSALHFVQQVTSSKKVSIVYLSWQCRSTQLSSLTRMTNGL